jgi:hypothetical protein
MPAATDPAAPHGPSGATLDRLQAMVNLVLTQTGRYIKEAKGGPGAGRAQSALKQSVPAALGRFHNSLDELEKELHQAQSALRRDLALLQADRRKREQAEAAERRRLALESSAKTSLSTGKEKPDAIMTDFDMSASSITSGNPAVESKMETGPSSLSLHHPAPPSATTAPPRDPLFDATPTTANPRESEFDFDAIFAGHDFATGHQTSSNETKEPHSNDNSGPALPNLEFRTNEDNSGSSLLQGLEDFANSASDNTTNAHASKSELLLSDMSTNPNQNEVQSSNQQATTLPAGFGSTGQQQPHPADGTQPPDPANVLDTVPDTNLDDLFSLDYGDAAEGTEFEDAFFQYGES